MNATKTSHNTLCQRQIRFEIPRQTQLDQSFFLRNFRTPFSSTAFGRDSESKYFQQRPWWMCLREPVECPGQNDSRNLGSAPYAEFARVIRCRRGRSFDLPSLIRTTDIGKDSTAASASGKGAFHPGGKRTALRQSDSAIV